MVTIAANFFAFHYIWLSRFFNEIFLFVWNRSKSEEHGALCLGKSRRWSRGRRNWLFFSYILRLGIIRFPLYSYHHMSCVRWNSKVSLLKGIGVLILIPVLSGNIYPKCLVWDTICFALDGHANFISSQFSASSQNICRWLSAQSCWR